MCRSYGSNNEVKSQNLPLPQQSAPRTPQRLRRYSSCQTTLSLIQKTSILVPLTSDDLVPGQITSKLVLQTSIAGTIVGAIVEIVVNAIVGALWRCRRHHADDKTQSQSTRIGTRGGRVSLPYLGKMTSCHPLKHTTSLASHCPSQNRTDRQE